MGARKVVNLYDAKTQLSRLVDRAAAGEEIVIAKNGVPKARLAAIRPARERKPGRFQGRITVAADFDAPLPADMSSRFAGGGE